MKSPFRRGGLRFFLVLVALFAGATTDLSIVMGIPLVVAGVALHLWAKGCLRQTVEVTQTGPYRFVRHPFYLANALIDAAIVVMSGSWVLGLILPLWWLAVYLPTIRREEAYLTRRFPEIYRDYQRRVPAFVPFRRPLSRTQDGFSWENPNIAGGREIPRALRLLAYPLLFFIWHGLLTEGAAFLRLNQNLGLLAVVTFLVLHALAWETKQSLKHRQPVFPSVFHADHRMVAIIVLLAVAGSLTVFETETDWAVMSAGIFIIISSLVFRYRKPQASLTAEAMVIVGILTLCEMPWLVGIPILLYAGLALDNKLTNSGHIVEPAQKRLVSNVFIPHLYNAILIGGIAVSLAKELLIG